MVALGIVRGIHFASLMAIFGAETTRLIFRSSLAQPPPEAFPRGWLTWCAGVGLITAILWLIIFSSQLVGGDTFDVRTIALVLQQTLFGRVMLARVTLLVLLMCAIPLSSAALPRILLSGAALAAISLTSHAAAAGGDGYLFLRAANDAVHLLAAGFWIGSLVALAPVVIAQRRSLLALAPALRLFSFWGMIAVSLLVAAGSLNTYFILFNLHTQWSAYYVGLLALKITLAAVMIALALVNRFHVLPAVEHQQPDSAENLITSSVMELVTGASVVVIVGILGTMSPSPG